MKALSMQEIRHAAPAAFAETYAPHLSAKYGFISTAEALKVMFEEGYHVVSASQDKARQRNPAYVRHSLTLRHESAMEQQAAVGEYVPQILLINSHNGRTKLSMRVGLFRFVCSNGMVVGDTVMQEAIRHSQQVATEVIDRLRHASAMTGQLFKKTDEWQKIELSEAQAQTFAQKAAELRFGKERAAMYAPSEILQLRRPEDEGNTLWRIFNRVQENTTTQSLEGKTANSRAVHSRPLLGIGENTAYNERLWSLAEEFAAQ
jgi:DNA-binding transcriptional regulator YbjK